MKFSIVIANYNSEKWIRKCLNSILNQTYKNYEIILVDDVSTDNSLKIAHEILDEYTNTKIIELKNKRLSGGARNEGINNAIGNYIMCIDCDDWLIDNKVLEDINNKLNNEDVMYLGFIMSTNKKTIMCNINNFDDVLNNHLPAPWLKVVKTELYKKCPFPEGTLYEDRLQNYKLALEVKTFTNLSRPTHYWNRQENATTFNPNWKNYRFEYCGELYRLIQEVKDGKIKDILVNELKMYMSSCIEMVESL